MKEKFEPSTTIQDNPGVMQDVTRYLKEKSDRGEIWSNEDHLLLLEAMGHGKRAQFHRKRLREESEWVI